MRGDEKAFLDAIKANPADDTARLVYADWLQDRAELGDADRAEFIRVQCEFERTKNEPDAFELDERSWRLWQANYKQWEGAPGATNHIRRTDLRRGFIEEMTPTAEWWLQHGDAIVVAHPVTRVALTTMPEVRLDMDLESAPHWKLSGRTQSFEVPFEVARGTAHDFVAFLLPQYWPGIVFELPSVSWETIATAQEMGLQLSAEWLHEATGLPSSQ